MTDFTRIGAAVVGTGFIGAVHLDALRRLGVPVIGVLGSSTARGKERANAMGVGRAYDGLDELLADPAVQLVHVTSPNVAHYDQVKQILAAGKHVICEKPLAMTSAQSAEMVSLAQASGKIAAVCYNTRFYPLNQQAHRMVADGVLGDIRLISGHYHQDWLAKPTDWNWRLETDQGGLLRSVGDIGTHWIDLISFIVGQKANAVFADLTTFLPVRQKPKGPIETFGAASGDSEPREITTDDAAMVMLRFSSGIRAVMSTSQISNGRKNDLRWEISGSEASAAWESEKPDHLWIGYRDAPNQILQRDASLMNATGAASTHLPGGHVEGFADTFRGFFAQVYRDVAQGKRASQSTYASFQDGHYEMQVCDAVVKSARDGRWIEIGG
jgi:predicted dehydrogenase